MSKTILTQERLKSILDYIPETGVFHWKKPGSTRMRVGQVAGADTNGYRQIRIDGTLHRSHRLVWMYVHGVWPVGCIDHINGVTNDNRIANLRDVSHAHNLQNQTKAHSNNTSGYLGVTRMGATWIARISVGHTKKYLGSFATADSAHRAYLEAKRSLHSTCML